MREQPNRRIFLQEFKAIGHAISTYKDLNVLQNHLVEGICRSFKIKACSILIFDDREGQLFHVSSHGLSKDYLRKGPINVQKEKFSEFVDGKPVFFKDFQNDPRVQYADAAIKEGIVSQLSVPIKYRDAVIGLLKMYNDEEWILHDEDLDSFCILAEQLGVVIENNGLNNFFEMVQGAMNTLPIRRLKG